MVSVTHSMVGDLVSGGAPMVFAEESDSSKGSMPSPEPSRGGASIGSIMAIIVVVHLLARKSSPL